LIFDINFSIPFRFKLWGTDTEKNQVFLSYIRNPLPDAKGDAYRIARADFRDIIAHFRAALSRKDVVNLPYLHGMPTGAYPGLHAGLGDGYVFVIGAVDDLCYVAAF